jgi:hypothetical protein
MLCIATALIAGCQTTYCASQPFHRQFSIDEPTAAAILSAEHDPTLCAQICRALEVEENDGGLAARSVSNAGDCTVVADGEMLRADCEVTWLCR